jgi:hypothetical protein
MSMRDDRMAGRSYFVEAGFETTAERMPSLEQPLPIEKPATVADGILSARSSAPASSASIATEGRSKVSRLCGRARTVRPVESSTMRVRRLP